MLIQAIRGLPPAVHVSSASPCPSLAPTTYSVSPSPSLPPPSPPHLHSTAAADAAASAVAASAVTVAATSVNVWAELWLLLSMDAGPDADAAVRVCQQNVQRLMAEQASAAERLGQAVQVKAYG